MEKVFAQLMYKLIHKFGGDNEDLITLIIIGILIVIAFLYSVYKEYKKEKQNGK